MDIELVGNAIGLHAVRQDPKDARYTIPRTFGVYRIVSANKRGASKEFRYGNHPIRQRELERDFGPVELIALYTDRTVAIGRAKAEENTL